MRLQWDPEALASAGRFLGDQPGMRAINAAVSALPGDPEPPWPDGAHHGTYHRLRVGRYRVRYEIDGDLITIRRVDRVRE